MAALAWPGAAPGPPEKAVSTCAFPEGGDEAGPLAGVLLSRDILLSARLAPLRRGALAAGRQVAGDGRLAQPGQQRVLPLWRVLLHPAPHSPTAAWLSPAGLLDWVALAQLRRPTEKHDGRRTLCRSTRPPHTMASCVTSLRRRRSSSSSLTARMPVQVHAYWRGERAATQGQALSGLGSHLEGLGGLPRAA